MGEPWRFREGCGTSEIAKLWTVDRLSGITVGIERDSVFEVDSSGGTFVPVTLR